MSGWTLAQAEEHLLGLERFGMRFELDRMRLLLAALGSPQERFDTIHIVGTNGKSSTVRMTAALLEDHGLRTGAYLSPHLTSFAERIRIGGEDLDPDRFSAAIERAAAAAEAVERELPAGELVTQFELLTAAAFDELARAGVEVAAIEAGLGGRFDATGVLAAPVVVLTNVGLEHTRWLGSTVPQIAAEKLAVVTPAATLVLGESDPEVVGRARATGARIVTPDEVEVELPGYQRANFGAACAAVRAYLRVRSGGEVTELNPAVVAHVAATIAVPGRFQIVSHEPLTIYDGAHNPSGIAALAAALPPQPFVAVVSILDDKDAAAMLATLAERCDTFICTATPSPRALPPAQLAAICDELGATSEIVTTPRVAVARAREVAGSQGAVIVCGSIYLIADLLSKPGARRASAL